MVEGSGEERGGMRVIEGRGGRREELEFKYRFVLHFYSPLVHHTGAHRPATVPAVQSCEEPVGERTN